MMSGLNPREWRRHLVVEGDGPASYGRKQNIVLSAM